MFPELAMGFANAISFVNLFYCIIGICLGMIVGILPGIGATAGIAFLLPITFSVDDTASALILMSGIYYGSMYGGSITSILLKLPGEISAVISAKDGHEMALKGEAGAALGITALGSFVGGCVATVCIAVFTPLLIQIVLELQPIEYFSIIVFGLICACLFATSTMLKSMIMLFFGIMLGCIGTDIQSGEVRYFFNNWNLASGLSFLAMIMGLYGIGEITYNVIHSDAVKPRSYAHQIKMFSKKSIEKMKTAVCSVLRGSGIGSVVGVLPGGGAIMSSFISYIVEKKISKTPENFGRGEIKGLASAESANNAGAQTSIIPLLCLGFPVNVVMALFLGVLLVHDIETGPSFIENNGVLFWTLIASMVIGNFLLVILNIFAIPLFLHITKINKWIINCVVLIACTIGVYYTNYNYFDILLMYIFGVIGYFLKKADFDFTPILLGYLLGPRLEEYFVQTMMLNYGDVTSFFGSWVSCMFYIISIVVVLIFRRSRKNG